MKELSISVLGKRGKKKRAFCTILIVLSGFGHKIHIFYFKFSKEMTQSRSSLKSSVFMNVTGGRRLALNEYTQQDNILVAARYVWYRIHIPARYKFSVLDLQKIYVIQLQQNKVFEKRNFGRSTTARSFQRMVVQLIWQSIYVARTIYTDRNGNSCL